MTCFARFHKKYELVIDVKKVIYREQITYPEENNTSEWIVDCYPSSR